jgi:adenosylcobinamide-GDP ribazoletransferase
MSSLRLRRHGAAARQAAAFLSPLVPGRGEPGPEAMALFPLVGAALGLCNGLLWRGARACLPPNCAGVVTVAADAALTGALHLDGLADAADGLLAHLPEKGRLDLMAEPAIGTFGALSLVLVLGARATALASAEPSPALLAALWCCSRSVMVVGSRVLPYARGEGLVSAFLADGEEGDEALRSGLCGIAAAVALAGVARGRRGGAGVLAGALAGTLVLWGAKRRLGGFTGDVLGAAGVICETVGLLVAAQW